MIVIISSSAHERVAFAALCESRRWACLECDSVHAVRKALQQFRPHVVLTRHQLNDGYSDDVVAILAAAALLPAVKIIVLLGPGASPAQVARQVALGADAVLRDPVRTEVLVEYLAKYCARAKAPPEKLQSVAPVTTGDIQ